LLPFFSAITLIVFSVGESFAGHIIGGDIYYDYLGNDQYAITMIVYKNCAENPNGTLPTGFDPTTSIGVFETATGDLVDEITIDLSDALIEEVEAVLQNPCYIIPSGVCIQQGRYTATITLPPIAGGYTISYQRCCRADAIINLIDDQGMTLAVTIPDEALIAGNNSSARFVNLPPVSLCLGADFFMDHQATDPDGDQLVYSFCSPLNGASPDNPIASPPAPPPYNDVVWDNGFTPSSPLPGNPQFSIDASTGYLTGVANQLGDYVIGICVSEIRNGQVINTVMRDFQFRVVNCLEAVADFSSIENSSYDVCSGLTVTFDNLGPPNPTTFYHWDFGVPLIETDTSNLVTPTFVFPAAGIYEVVLTANPGWPCEDVEIQVYTVYPPVIPTITVGSYECIDLFDTYDFSVSGSYSALADISWNFGTGAIPATSANDNPANVRLPENSPSWTITVQVEDNGCIGTDTETIINAPDAAASIQPQDVFCNGLTYDFSSNSLNATSHTWDFGGLGTEDLSDILNPTYQYVTGGTYEVSLYVTGTNSCNDTSTISFDIAENPVPYFEPQSAQCLANNSFGFEAEGATTLNPQYTWSFGPSSNIGSSTVAEPSGISFNTPGYHPVTLTISESGCSESYTDSVGVAQHILPDFQVESISGCPGLVAQVVAVTESVVPVNYIWDFGNGALSSQGITVQTYDMPGSYSITATAFTNEGCYDSLTMTFPNAVTIYPNPDASFTIDPQVMDIAYAETHIASVYQDGTCQYFMSDGGEISDCEFDYSWTASGRQTITHYVTSPQGCTSSATGEITIQGFTFYAPTSFSPNNDGINDFWLPVMTGITSIDIRIYNRWGDLIYHSNDLNRPWSGQIDSGNHYAANGSYNYRILAQDLTLQSHEFTGSFMVIR
jgi:gliding motility-associated-like protein